MITVSELIENQKHIRLATVRDNHDIVEFIKSVPMEMKNMKLSYERGPNYFGFLNLQGENHFTFLLLNKDESIGGIGVITIRKCFHEKNSKKIAYLSDLRLSPTLYKRTRVEWRNVYATILRDYKSILEFSRVLGFYSIILDNNDAAISSLTSNKKDVCYHEIGKNQVLSIYGFRPLPFIKGTELEISLAKSSEEIKLYQFLHQQQKSKDFGYHFTSDETPGEFERRQDYLEGFETENFYVAKDEAGKILASMIPVEMHQHRSFKVQSLGNSLKFKSLLIPLLGGRKLVERKSLKTLYISCLEFSEKLSTKQKRKILLSFIQRINEDFGLKFYNNIVLANNIDLDLSGFLTTKGYLNEPLNENVYQVLHKDQYDRKEVFKNIPPFQLGFEACLG